MQSCLPRQIPKYKPSLNSCLMKTKEYQKIKLGLFVIAGLAIFIISIYYIGHKQTLFGDTTRIVSVFKNVNGLQVGNNVRFAGVDVGTVKSISIINDTAVYVEMQIQSSTIRFIKKQSVAAVGSDGLVGSMVVDILPPTEESVVPIEAGDTISSISQIATADLLATLSTTNENAALLTADMLKITKAINSGEGVLGKLLKDQEMASDLQQSIENIKHVSWASAKTINEINSKLSQIDMNESVAGVFLNDTVATKKVLAIIDDLNQSASEIDSITTRIDHFSKAFEEGDGVVSYALNDTSFVNHLENTIRNVEAASFKFDQNMEALKHNILFRGYFRKLERRKQRALSKD